MSDVARAFFESLADPDTKALDDRLEGIRAKVEERRRQNYTPAEVNAFRDELLHELQSTFWDVQRSKAMALRERAEQTEARYKRERDADPHAALLELRRQELAVEAATDQGLVNMAQEYLNAEGESLAVPPEHLHVLVRELHQRARRHDGEDLNDMAVTVDNLVSVMEDRRFREPWRHTAPELYAELELAAAAEYGTFAVRDESGRVQSFPITDLIGEEQ